MSRVYRARHTWGYCSIRIASRNIPQTCTYSHFFVLSLELLKTLGRTTRNNVDDSSGDYILLLVMHIAALFPHFVPLLRN